MCKACGEHLNEAAHRQCLGEEEKIEEGEQKESAVCSLQLSVRSGPFFAVGVGSAVLNSRDEKETGTLSPWAHRNLRGFALQPKNGLVSGECPTAALQRRCWHFLTGPWTTYLLDI